MQNITLSFTRAEALALATLSTLFQSKLINALFEENSIRVCEGFSITPDQLAQLKKTAGTDGGPGRSYKIQAIKDLREMSYVKDAAGSNKATCGLLEAKLFIEGIMK